MPLGLDAPGANGDPWTARLAMSKTLLAARLGFKKETLSRLLREFADHGMIAVCGRDIAICDREGLKQLAASMPPE